MAIKLILRGYSGTGIIGTSMAYSLDNSEIAVVKKNDRVERILEKGGILTAVLGGIRKSSNSIMVKDNTAVEVLFKQNIFTGSFTLEKGSEEEYKSEQTINEEPAEKAVYEFDGGVNDILFVYEERIVIRHKGILNAIAMGIKGDKTIYYSDLTSVQFKKPGFAAGYIQFSLPGGNENKGGVFSAMGDENTISISQSADVFLAEKVVEYINEKIREFKSGKGQATTIVQQTSSADELKKFKELLDMGVITQDEFDAKKKQLLGL